MTRIAVSLSVLLLLASLQASQAQCDDVSGVYDKVWVEQTGCRLSFLGWGSSTGAITGSLVQIYYSYQGWTMNYSARVVDDNIVVINSSYVLYKRPCAMVGGLYTRDRDNVTWLAVGQTTCSLMARTPSGMMRGTVNDTSITFIREDSNGTELYRVSGMARRTSTISKTYIDLNESGYGLWWETSVVPCFSKLEFAPTEACWAGLSPMLRNGTFATVNALSSQEDVHDYHCFNDGHIQDKAECIVKSCSWDQAQFEDNGDGCHCSDAACIALNLGYGTRAGGHYCEHNFGHGTLAATLPSIMPSCCPQTQRSICTVLAWSGTHTTTLAGPLQRCIRIPEERARTLNLAGCTATVTTTAASTAPTAAPAVATTAPTPAPAVATTAPTPAPSR